MAIVVPCSQLDSIALYHVQVHTWWCGGNNDGRYAMEFCAKLSAVPIHADSGPLRISTVPILEGLGRLPNAV